MGLLNSIFGKREDDNVKEGYFEVNLPGIGIGYCDDTACGCNSRIPNGEGYLYITQEVVDFRKGCRSLKTCSDKIRKRYGGYVFLQAGIAAPMLVCERAARIHGLDLETAAADAKYWWETTLVPLRATPTNR